MQKSCKHLHRYDQCFLNCCFLTFVVCLFCYKEESVNIFTYSFTYPAKWVASACSLTVYRSKGISNFAVSILRPLSLMELLNTQVGISGMCKWMVNYLFKYSSNFWKSSECFHAILIYYFKRSRAIWFLSLWPFI